MQQAQQHYQQGEYRHALKLYLKLLNQSPNNKQISYWIGRCYEQLKEFPKARDAYRKSQDPDGLYRLGMLFMTGEKQVAPDQKRYKLAKDPKKALECFKQSQTTQALQELLKAQDDVFHPLYHLKRHVNIGKVKCLLATRFLLGDEDVDPNEKLALELYRESSKEGYASGFTGVGYMYEHGLADLQPSMTKAIELYQQAAELGCVRAMSNLGNCYLEGVGVEPNPQLAVKYLSKAAALGDADSMQSLGLYYAKEKLLNQANDEGSIISEPLSSARLTVTEKPNDIPESVQDSMDIFGAQTDQQQQEPQQQEPHQEEEQPQRPSTNAPEKEPLVSSNKEAEKDTVDAATKEETQISALEKEVENEEEDNGLVDDDLFENDILPQKKPKKQDKTKQPILTRLKSMGKKVIGGIQLVTGGLLTICNLLAVIVAALVIATSICMYILYDQDFRYLYIPLGGILAWPFCLIVIVVGGIAIAPSQFMGSTILLTVNMILSVFVLFFTLGVAGGSFVVLGILHKNNYISFSLPWE